MKVNKNLTSVKCSGLNLIKLINKCSENELCLNNLSRIDAKTITFSLSDKDLKKLKYLDFKDYTIEVTHNGGIKRFLNTIYFRMGLLIGIVLSVMILFFINNRLFNVQIMGLENVNEEEVNLSLYDFGVKRFELMDFNKTELENYLSQKFNFSFVSVITKGNSLIINVKEELLNITTFEPITSPYNMVITKINVFSGTSRLSVGDIVYEGDMLS